MKTFTILGGPHNGQVQTVDDKRKYVEKAYDNGKGGFFIASYSLICVDVGENAFEVLAHSDIANTAEIIEQLFINAGVKL